MRANITIDDELMKEAQAASGAKTKREVVEAALRTYVRLARQGDIRKHRGMFQWEGDLEAMRLD